MVMTRTAPPGVRTHKARGLCSSCYVGVLERDELDQYPRNHRASDQVLEEYLHLYQQGEHDHTRLAAQLGLSPRALYNVLHRARAAGDPRANGSATAPDDHQGETPGHEPPSSTR
jgi:hypothetical protein